MPSLKTNCLPMLVGSLPIKDHDQAMELILKYTPDIPLWPQLPKYKEEGMVQQYVNGLPGLDICDETLFINAQGDEFDAAYLEFYEEYLMISEGGKELEDSRFTLDSKTAKGFFTFLQHTENKKDSFTAVKAQTTGPFTFATGLVDHNNKAIFYNEQLRDAAIKLLALKAKWQIRRMKEICPQTIMIFDEPAMAGFGSSAFITISADDIKVCFGEVFDAVHDEGGVAGVHVCANTEWSVLFDAGVELVSFDAYSYFDRFILYPEHLKTFFNNGGILASGIIPTDPELVDKEDGDSLTAKWIAQAEELEKIGIPMEQVLQQSLITPSCGTGSITLEYADKVMALTREVSENIRKHYNMQ
jgi:hypothetical protein